VFCFATICFSNDHTHVETNYKNFKQDVIKKWTTYCKNLCNYSGKINQKNEWSDRIGLESQSYEYEIIGKFPCVLKEETNKDKTTIYCTNSNYSFRLKSVSNSDEWIVDEVVQSTHQASDFFEDINNINISSKRYNVNNIVTRSLAAGLDINGTLLPAIFNDFYFEILNIESLHENDVNITRVMFQYNSPSPDKATFPRSGTIDLLTDYYMLVLRANIISSQVGFDDQWNFIIENKYDLLPKQEDNIPLIISSQRRCLDIPPISSFRYSLNFTYNISKTNSDISFNRFTLSHYGIPEPDFGERRTNRVRYILIGLGAIMIAIALWRMIQKRREQM
jgi:hypothetical protein